jgi:hypothetical protein
MSSTLTRPTKTALFRHGLALVLAVAVGASCSASVSTGAGSTTSGGNGTGSGPAGSGGSAPASSGSGGTSTNGGGTAAGTGTSGGPAGSANSPGTTASTGGASFGSGGSAAAGTGGAAAPPSCTVSLTPIAPTSFDALVAGADARFRVQATVGGGTRAPKWVWTVSYAPDLSAVIPVTTVSDPSTVEFPITMAGIYSIQVVVDAGLSCFAERAITVQPPEKNVLVFSITPPDVYSQTIPAQKIKKMVAGTAPAPLSIALQGGTAIRILPQTAAGDALPSYVRVRGLSFSSVIEGYSDHGPVPAVLLPYPTEVYEALVIPDDVIAPQIFSGGDLLGDPQRLVALSMSAGTEVTGAATNAGGQPVAGVRVVLRSGSRPSTVGTTAADGTFSVLTRAGTHAMVFSPPLDSGLPEVHVPVSPGFAVATSDTSISASLVWAPSSSVPVTLHVRSTDGASDVPGAWVRLESPQELPSVATVSIRGSAAAAAAAAVTASANGTPTPTPTSAANPPRTMMGTDGVPVIKLSASGIVRVDATTGTTGLARFSAVPVGTYTVTIVPPDGMSALAMPTRASVVVAAGGLSSTLSLAAPVVLSGRLLPVAETARMRVVALDQTSGIPAPPVATTVDDSGNYRLALPPGRTYQLEADPLGIANFARTVFGMVALGGQDQAAPDFQVAAGVAISGTVSGPPSDPQQLGPVAMGGALIQIFCSSLSAACPAPDQPVAEVATRADGTFRVFVPAALLTQP